MSGADRRRRADRGSGTCGFTRSVGVGIALAVLAAGPAQAAESEVSVTQRLEDRREVAAGTRAQVLGFEDGRFYAQRLAHHRRDGRDHHPAAEAASTPSTSGVNEQWVGPATRFTSGWGYVRYDLPPIDGVGLQRTDFAPTAAAARLIGLKLTNPRKNKQTVKVMVDAHSELMTQYPWGFGGTVPNASENAQDRGVLRQRAASCSATPGSFTGESGNHSYTAIVGSDRDPRRRARPGPATTARSARAARCAADQTPGADAQRVRRRPVRSRHGRPAALQRATSRAPAPRRCGSPSPARRTRSPRRAASSAALTDDPAGPARREEGLARAAGALDQARPAGRPAAAGLDRVGQAEPRRPHAAGDRPRHPLDQPGQGVDARGRRSARMRWVGAGFPDYPWLFAVDGEYTAHASVTLGQFDPIKDHMRAVRDISDILSDGSGVVVHEVVADGSVWYGKDARHTNPDTGAVTCLRLQHGRDRQVPGRHGADLALDGRQRLPRRDARLHVAQPRVRRARSSTRTHDGWPEGNGNVERPGHGRGEARQRRLLHPRPVRLRRHGAVGRARPLAPTRPRRAPTGSRPGSRTSGGSRREQQYADSLKNPGNVKVNQKHWIGVDPMEVELYPRRRVRAGSGRLRQRLARRSRRARTTATAASGRATAGSSTPAAAAGRTGDGRVRDLLAQHRHPGGRRGQLRPPRRRAAAPLHRRQRRDPVLRAGDRRHARRAAGRDAGDHAVGGSGARRRPGSGTPPNIDRCWTCRSMFMQAWGHYGTAWAVVHQQLGVRPHLGHDWLEVVPQVPEGQPSVQGRGHPPGRRLGGRVSRRTSGRATRRRPTPARRR